jgi:hypothetical protein
MTAGPSGGGKLPGKTLYAGRRRAMTRTSGFKVHKDTTGGEFRRHLEKIVPLRRGESVKVIFRIAGHAPGDLIGYGLWFWCSPGVKCSLEGGPERRTLTEYGEGSWNKAGSIWSAHDGADVEVIFTLTAAEEGAASLYAPICGQVRHKHLDGARPELMRNMYQFSPEALFVTEEGAGEVTVEAAEDASTADNPLTLKSCNRCGRYLPVNVPIERDQLSFSNHCVAEHRRPCRHATFGRLRNVEDHAEVMRLDYGFQLECRFCKKFEVNAAHNPQRSTAQMKEDGARRRAFELLLAELYGGTPQLRYRHENGSELADDVWRRFGGACFNCGTKLPTPRDMHLDHTRPLALLWPLDGTATALCGSCNSEKRDRSPANFYTPAKLALLAKITGVPIIDLSRAHPNDEALDFLLSKLDWFFGEFLLREEMTKERDGKVAGELVVKALQKVIARSGKHSTVDLQAEYERRRAKKQ